MEEKVTPGMSDLLSRAEQGLEITTRDDQDEFAVFLDAAKISRRKGGRIRLIDTGKFNAFELEWLAEAGADLYTSDEARPSRTDLDLLAKACTRGDAIIAYFQWGALTEGPADTAPSWDFLREIGRSGVNVHLSNRVRPYSLVRLADVAEACRKAGARLVYYHHGRPEDGLEALARTGGWIHLSGETLEADLGVISLLEVAREASAAGSGVVVHLERRLSAETLGDLLKAGAFLLFKTLPSEWRLPQRAVEEQARQKTLDRRSFYLDATFLP
jgi:hypothetical protein